MAKRRRRSPDAPSISDAELEVLNLLWEHDGMTPSDLQTALQDDGRPAAYTTVQTFLHRLHDKGYVTRRQEGRTWVYEASFTRDEVVLGEVDRLAKRVCGGRSSALVLSFVQSGRLSKKDLSQLRSVLDEAEAQLGPKKKRG